MSWCAFEVTKGGMQSSCGVGRVSAFWCSWCLSWWHLQAYLGKTNRKCLTNSTMMHPQCGQDGNLTLQILNKCWFNLMCNWMRRDAWQHSRYCVKWRNYNHFYLEWWTIHTLNVTILSWLSATDTIWSCSSEKQWPLPLQIRHWIIFLVISNKHIAAIYHPGLKRWVLPYEASALFLQVMWHCLAVRWGVTLGVKSVYAGLVQAIRVG